MGIYLSFELNFGYILTFKSGIDYILKLLLPFEFEL